MLTPRLCNNRANDLTNLTQTCWGDSLFIGKSQAMKTIDPSLLEEITRRLVAEFEPEQIILFGSHAWGMP